MDIIIKPSTKKPWYDRSPVRFAYRETGYAITGDGTAHTVLSHTVSAGKKAIVTGGNMMVMVTTPYNNASIMVGYYFNALDILDHRYIYANRGSYNLLNGDYITVPAPFGEVLSEGETVRCRDWIDITITLNRYYTLVVQEFDA